MAAVEAVAPQRVIEKPRGGWAIEPNLVNYEQTCARFSWDEARRTALSGLAGGALNIAYEAVDRHAASARASHLALRCIGRDDKVCRELSYTALALETNRFANVLASLGVERGEHVFALADRTPDLYVAALGTLKHGCVFAPLFAAFGPDPIQSRLVLGHGAVLVTTPALYRRKVAVIRDQLPELRHVLLVHEGETTVSPDAGAHDLGALMRVASDRYDVVPTRADEPALLHFTSGTTGTPKGAVHVHEAVLSHHVTARLALDLHPDDVFWCTADPGWVTGTSYGIVAPLTNGVTSIVDEGDFDPARWYRLLQDERVTVWYTAPTAVRMLMRAGAGLAKSFDLSALRFIASVGEPLNPEGVLFGMEAFGQPIHDNWWQTETGGIMIANFRSMDVRPGSMGRPLPGITAGIVRRGEGDAIAEVPDGEDGELALRPGWPSMFRAYLGDDERYARTFAGGWYLTGDLARRDADGYYWFIGRADDVIKSSGHLIGPFEVESTLLEHGAVAEAAVIGKPDPVAGEIVKAFVALKPGNVPDDALRADLLAFARKRLGAVVAPKELVFVDAVPRTRSGKIMRRLLRARELGLPEGDLSTLEAGAHPEGRA